MAVYVDNSKFELQSRDRRIGTFVMCRMTADSIVELTSVLAQIGVDSKWIQRSSSGVPWVNICQSKKKLAIELSAAKEISESDMSQRMAKIHAIVPVRRKEAEGAVRRHFELEGKSLPRGFNLRGWKTIEIPLPYSLDDDGEALYSLEDLAKYLLSVVNEVHAQGLCSRLSTNH